MPQVLDTAIYDELLAVTDQDAFAAGRLMARTEGVLVGISSGAALWAAVELAKRPENRGKTIVTLLPDTGDRYLSTGMFDDSIMAFCRRMRLHPPLFCIRESPALRCFAIKNLPSPLASGAAVRYA